MLTPEQRQYAARWNADFRDGLRDTITRYPELAPVNFDDPPNDPLVEALRPMPWVNAAEGVTGPDGQPWMALGGLWLAAGLEQWEHLQPEEWRAYAWASFVSDHELDQDRVDTLLARGLIQHHAVELGYFDPRTTFIVHQPRTLAAALLSATYAWCVQTFGRPNLP